MDDQIATPADFRPVVGEALDVLAQNLGPFVASVLSSYTSTGSWTLVIQQKDEAKGIRGKTYSESDLALMLRVLTERLGDIGFPFDGYVSREAKNHAQLLRDVRNQWAHYEPFTKPKAYRAIDSVEVLLEDIGADDVLPDLQKLKQRILADPQTQAADPSPSTVPATPSEPEATPTLSEVAATPPATETAEATATSVATSTTDISLAIEMLEFVSYAIAHIGVPIISSITVNNTGDQLTEATLELELTSSTNAVHCIEVQMLDIDAGKTTTISNPRLRIDPSQMMDVDELTPATLTVSLRDSAGKVLGHTAQPVSLIPHAHWIAAPLQLGLEILPAFVQPNSSAIPALLSEAADYMESKGQRTGFTGYQDGDPQRVDQVAEAIYEAMRARDIRYAEPPSSWSGVGQRIRTPHEVLDERLGTCLDTVTTMAAAFEQAGIRTTLWLVKGHIFLGYWRYEHSLDVIATGDIEEVVNLVDLEMIGLIETTALTGGADSADFATATSVPQSSHLSGSLDNVMGITDVRRAREAGITPLPSRSVNADGEVIVTHYQAAATVIAPFVPSGTKPTQHGDRPLAPARVEQWKNALLDLSLRNRLINYTARTGITIGVPAQAMARFEDEINAGTSITLAPSDSVSFVDAARGVTSANEIPADAREVFLAEKRTVFVDIPGESYASRLRSLAYKAKTLIDETGANNLYLAFGMLSWYLDGKELRSPLVLVPVNIVTSNRGTTYKLVLDEAGTSTPNFCLLEKLRATLNLEIPGLANPVEDSSGIDLPAAFAAVREALVTSGTKGRVEETVDLAILQFAKFRLWKDLDDHWQSLASNKLVSHLIHTPSEKFIDPVESVSNVDLDLLSETCPVEADASQLEAVASAANGNTFVLEGPPGTGKSQTITNLLANSVASGKRVLFVAEKQAALNVVKKRLDAVGLGTFSLDLHSKASKPIEVRRQIRTALEASVVPDHGALASHKETAAAGRASLHRYANRLHEPNACELSLYEAHKRSLGLDPMIQPIDVPREYVRNASEEAQTTINRALSLLPELHAQARPNPNHPWRFIDTPIPANDLPAVHRAAQAFDSAVTAALNAGLTLDQMASLTTPADVERWIRLSGAPRFSLEAIEAAATTLHQRLNDALTQLTSLDRAPEWLRVFTPAVLSIDTNALHTSATAADQSGMFSRKKHRRIVVNQYAQFLAIPPDSVDLESLSRITAAVAETGRQIQNIKYLLSSLPVETAPTWSPFNQSDYDSVIYSLQWLQWLPNALGYPQAPTQLAQTLRSYYATSSTNDHGAELANLNETYSALVSSLRIDAMQTSVLGAEFIPTWHRGGPQRNLSTSEPVTLAAWNELLTLIEPLRRHGLTPTREQILDGQIDADEAKLALSKGVTLESIDERLDSTSLVGFSTEAQMRAITRVIDSHSNIRALLPTAIPAQLIGRRDLGPADRKSRFGELLRELNRQRGGKKVRALMESYADLITQITPCVLMSPDSVSRFLPVLPGMFDIVVFDEASQIRVADAIGAMGRAHSVVVVGDSKQMPPTSFGEPSIAEESSETLNVVQDEESILSECVQAQIPSHWLSWHYRSQDESLIAFSNHQYYDDRLSSFPAPHADSTGDLGVSLVRVNGTFNRSERGAMHRTNQVEADAIVNEIQKRFRHTQDAFPSVGVVTFNAQQRDLIDNMLRDLNDERITAALEDPDGLFVKNLENVQGDERDTILFSIAFSANDKGVVPLNFGPLSRAGGERRLNVAITRARRQVILFASFSPDALRAEQTSSIGIKHLRGYLELAQRGAQAATEMTGRQAFADQHRDAIANALRDRGLAVKTDVGLSDFRVDIAVAPGDEPERLVAAVLLDGPQWRGRRTVNDRDGLPTSVLKNLMHWPVVERIWLPEWLQDPNAPLDRIEAAIAAVPAPEPVLEDPDDVVEPAQITQTREEIQPPTVIELPSIPRVDLPIGDVIATQVAESSQAQQIPQVQADQPSPVAYVSAQIADPVESAEFRQWEPAVIGSVETLDQLDSSTAARSQVAVAVVEAIEFEGPISAERLARRIAAAFSLNRVNAARERDILREVPASATRTPDGFIWPAKIDPQTWQGFRPCGPGERDLKDIALTEIANAARSCATQRQLQREELQRATLAIFGGKRVTKAIQQRLDEALLLAVETNRLSVTNTGAYSASPMS